VIKAIVTDIEGTTSSLSFVKEVLFPYARDNLSAFLHEQAYETEVAEQLNAVRAEVGQKLTLDEIIAVLQRWIDEDRKITPLKALQGFIWESGYRRGDFCGHVYADAEHQLRHWHQQGIKLYVYSSGSVYAQKLLFGHTEFGDLTPLFSGYFDTRVGAKGDRESYRKISASTDIPAPQILFLSDVITELDAARETGMRTVQLMRDGELDARAGHPQVHDFTELERLIAASSW
jgi:enolase-phosphatase E1